jgi:prepilin peptidase CpaA
VIISELTAAAILVLACGFAGWSDLFRRRIPNWLCAITAISGLAIAMVGGSLGLVGNHALHAAIALAVGMALFALRIVGGGDAKFYAAIAAWFPLRSASALFMLVGASGLVLLVIWFVARRLAGKPIRKGGNDPFDGLPYGIAIASGAVIMNFMANG